VVLLPWAGAKFALLAIVAGYCVLALAAAGLSADSSARTAVGGWSSHRTMPIAAIATAAFVIAAVAPPLAFVEVPAGGRIVSYRDGSLASVSVVADADGVARLRIDNRAQEGSSATRLADARQGVLPLLLHPNPRRALFLGLGTGVTAGAAAEDAQLDVDAVE